MIITLDATPLVTLNISGVQQHARNIVSEWSRQRVLHKFVLLINQQCAQDPACDLSFVKGLTPGFSIRFVRPSTRGWLKHEATRLPFLSGLSQGAADAANVYHSFSPDISAFSELPAAPICHTIHDLSCELDPAVRSSPAAAEDRRICRQAVKKAACTITVSLRTMDDIISLYHPPRQQVHVVSNGLNPVFTAVPDPVARQRLHDLCGPLGRYILVVGADIPRRNYARIWEAMRGVWQVEPGLRLVFAGRNPWSVTPIHSKVIEQGFQDCVTFIESPDDNELAELYRNAQLTCCGSSFEGFGLSVLEAMACGSAVACSHMRSLEALAGNSVVYFSHDDVRMITESILALIQDPEYRRQLRTRALARTALYSWARSAQTLMDLFEKIATRRTTPVHAPEHLQSPPSQTV